MATVELAATGETLADRRRPRVGRAARGGRTDGRLPVEIAFLAAHGVASDHLRQAAFKAAEWGVSAQVALIALGALNEAGYYRALATELNVPFLPRPRAGASARYPQDITAGIVPLAVTAGGPRFAIAPAGPMLAHLLGARVRLGSNRVAITTPKGLAASVMAQLGPAIAHRAANDLADRDPALSFRGGSSRFQLAMAGVMASALVCAAMLLPGEILSLAIAPSGLIFLAMVVLRLGACIEDNPARASPLLARLLDESELPHYTILVPLYRERRVVKRLVPALKAIDYPPAKLDIKIVLEADDDGTRKALFGLDLPDHFDILVAPPGLPRTKPRALNVALPSARGELLVIFDAEDIPDPDQLKLAAATFARAPSDIACLQARLVIDNSADGWLPAFFSLEYAALFDVMIPALTHYGLPVPLGGTSNHFRTEVLRGLDGWDAWNVTEDADLGIRLARKGWRVGDLPSATLEEAPAELTAWLGQRARWLKGWMQVCLTHSREPRRVWRELGPAAFAGAVAISLGTVVSALAFPLFTALFVLAALDGSLLSPRTAAEIAWAALALTVFGSGLAAMLLPAFVGARRRGLTQLLPLVPLLPVYFGLVSLAAWRALHEFATAPSRWNKTEHGLAKTSRSGALRDSAGVPLPPRRPAASD